MINKPIVFLIAALSCLVMARSISWADETPVAHPPIPALSASSVYKITVDGIPIPVNDESHFDFHTAFFSMEKPAELSIEFMDGTSFQSIHPLRYGIEPEVAGNTVRFTLEKPLKLVIKASGGAQTMPLALCATPIEKHAPSPGDPDVLYYDAGVHEAGVIKPTTGQTVYLAPGALVKGRIEVNNATGVTIHGRGTLDARGYSQRNEKTSAILFDRCQDVHVEGIGIRGGSWWMTLFLLTRNASIQDVSLLGKTVNTDGIDIDGVENFVARNCFIRCEDDGFGWHALDAEANGEPLTENCLAEDCVIWNTKAGNGLRIGASMETQFFRNIIFRNIDVLMHAGSAIYSDHSDWARCENIRFENFTIESLGGKGHPPIKMYITKTRYSNNTGYRDERGHYDGIQFINITMPKNSPPATLQGFDANHRIQNVLFKNCHQGNKPIDSIDDISINEFVDNVLFDE